MKSANRTGTKQLTQTATIQAASMEKLSNRLATDGTYVYIAGGISAADTEGREKEAVEININPLLLIMNRFCSSNGEECK